MNVSLDGVLDFVKRRWESASRAETRAVEAVRAALDAYEAGQKQRGVAQLAHDLGMEVTVPDVDTLALAVLYAVEQLPEIAGHAGHAANSVTRTQVVPELVEDEQGPAVARFPRLVAALRAGAEFRMVGGTVVPAKLSWARRAILGEDSDHHEQVGWDGIESDSDARVCDRVVNSARAGRICGVIAFSKFSSHGQTSRLWSAREWCPVILVESCGQAELLRAFEEIERSLEQRAAA